MLNYKTFKNVQPLNRGLNLRTALKSARIEGYFMEFGVSEGVSLNLLARDRKDITFHGFDSFEGLPEDWILDGWGLKKGHFKTKIPKVENNVKLHVGLFQDTLPKWKKTHPNKVAFLHIDSDLYSSCKYVLNELNDRITKGTIIVFDELMAWQHQNPLKDKLVNHEWKALNEWTKEKSRYLKPICRGIKCESTVLVTS